MMGPKDGKSDEKARREREEWDRRNKQRNDEKARDDSKAPDSQNPWEDEKSP